MAGPLLANAEAPNRFAESAGLPIANPLGRLPDRDWYDICAHFKCTPCGSGRLGRSAAELVRGDQLQQGRLDVTGADASAEHL